MGNPSLNSKTIRPGSLGAYAKYYHSSTASTPVKVGRKRLRHGKLKALMMLVVLSAVIGGAFVLTHAKPVPKAVSASKQLVQKPAPSKPVPSASVVAPVATNYCAGNTLDQLALVSISQRHMWACDGSKTVYDSPVITGIDYLAADITPVGTYHVYAKITDTTLRGSDTTGSWSDPVSFWMPFLHNQYGSYGFHDATWRAASDFGNISPNSSDASHGCVELPLATASWLYSWAKVGTTVTIES